ncbi:transglycosylase domain-containing protein [Pallidibacillus pasinlerensis]|uniref:Peptidoglycan glycosyltransferase n=1 Tax=Pallidibacillus pasinlerensis TaxID=2703818 RepID=A0ABX0A0X5_9BACI|nr:transglycosylase domain-containing protein [Pallidibacillus pasinlerensis]NCU16991.1 peptidoglycan glycosyltransferase [Pallidibacillus pasinlerensis]
MRLKEYWDNFSKKLAPLKEKLNPIINKTKPIKEALFNEKSAKAFRITYDVVWNLILVFTILSILGVALVLGVGAGYFASLVKDEYPRTYEEMKKDIYSNEEQSEVYLAGDVYLGDLRSEIIREEVKIEDVSEHVINGIIAVEDENFFTHNGVVPKAVFRALFQEFTNAPIQTGGSTLTQQLVKNQILTNEVSFERKAKEILLALRLEKFFSKEEIIEAYLNSTTFGRNSNGRNIAGVQTAARGIFGVDAKDLNLAQAAFIAGLPQSPSAYTPFTNKGTLKSEEGLAPGLDRQKHVLQRMHEEGFINDQEYEEAISYDIVADFIPPQEEEINEYKYLIQETEKRAIEILMQFHYEKDGYTKEDVDSSKVLRERYSQLAYRDLRQNGYRIYTTIDKDIYDKFQEVTREFGKNAPTQMIERDGELVEVPLGIASMLVENKTGRIIAFSGGLDFEKQNQNHATQSVRSNGSTMKPILVYGPAFDMGYAQPGTPLADVELGWKEKGKPWPNNISRRYYGLVSARTALTNSYNVSTVYLYNRIMHTNPVKNYLEKLGVTTIHESDYEARAMALGAMRYGMTVEETTNAFAAFGNNGQFADAYLIEKIEDKDGNIIHEHKVEPVEVFSPQAAYLTVDVMRDVVKSGTARSLPGRLNVSMDLAGKTGTSHNTHDKWFVGLNPNVTLGVWVGFEKQKPVPSSIRHLNYWADLMNATVALKPEIIGPEDRFEQPEGIVSKSFCRISGKLPSGACSGGGLVGTDLFIDKYVPTEADNSLSGGGKYVEINGKRYMALDSTPSEFTKSGALINPDYIDQLSEGLPKRISPSELFLNNSSLANVLVADAKIAENGKIPSAPSISISGNTITWGKHGENDVIGYRVYNVKDGQKGNKVASIPAGSNLSYTISGFGSFAVTAVDIAGQESGLSNVVSHSIPDAVDEIIDEISNGIEDIVDEITSPGDEENNNSESGSENESEE